MEHAHDQTVWSLTYHPLGHLLVSGSNDFTTRFWTRCRPGMLRNTHDRFHVGRDAARELGAKDDDEDDDKRGPSMPVPLPGIGMGGSYSRPSGNDMNINGAIPGFGGGAHHNFVGSGGGARYDGASVGGPPRAVYSGRSSQQSSTPQPSQHQPNNRFQPYSYNGRERPDRQRAEYTGRRGRQ